ncbi:kinesin-like protein KIF12 isoform X1 [Dendroctonus ponderosae]|nr:kinesin-like protein KIF12 isoform X1 [Dendroctonus ponderosae]
MNSKVPIRKQRSSPVLSETAAKSPDRTSSSNWSNSSNGSPEPGISRSQLGTRKHESESGSVERLNEDNSFRKITTNYNQNEDNINVVVRVRPLSKKEMQRGDTQIVDFPGNGQIMVGDYWGNVHLLGSPIWFQVDHCARTGSDSHKPKRFSYNVVFEPGATQEDVLQFSGMKRLISMAIEGFRCTCFCYGQTGSGKTHTLTGPPGLIGTRTVPYSENHGLIFRSFQYLFQQIQLQSDTHFVLKASYLEIYNEKVIDLLNSGSLRKPLAVRWSKKACGFFVENLFTVDCEELDDLIAVLEEGLRNRSIGRHNMNDYSSRSHTILTVHISSELPAENGVFISRTGKINFVDLAGSEMTKKTQSQGKMLEEANNINKSLMVLGYCIATLSDPKKRSSHIPYRDSKLTKLLADSLAGNGATLMIACISPAKSNACETVNTLRYAARAKEIRTKPVVLMDPREALILSLKREIDVLQNENKHLRSALHIYSSSTPSSGEQSPLKTPPHVDFADLGNLEWNELTELVRLYVKENAELRKKNNEFFTAREQLQRDHELVCRENERLSKKLEELKETKSD